MRASLSQTAAALGAGAGAGGLAFSDVYAAAAQDSALLRQVAWLRDRVTRLRTGGGSSSSRLPNPEAASFFVLARPPAAAGSSGGGGVRAIKGPSGLGMYQYTTLEDTLTYIRSHRPARLSSAPSAAAAAGDSS